MNPRLITARSPATAERARRALPGYDAVLQGEAGIMDMTGFADGEPTRRGRDHRLPAGLYATQGILLALNDRPPAGWGMSTSRCSRRCCR
jgi:crotonobetainyl-CoA:carnitine CoA-transferase CaiB-like acyl-CoA transferase